MNTELNSHQKEVIKQIGQRLAQAQAAYLKTKRECLTNFTEVVGYDSPADARQYVSEQLLTDEDDRPTFLFDKADWSKSLTRIALRELRARANDQIEAALEKLNS